MSDRRKVTPNFYAMVLLLSCLNEVENVQAMSIALDMLFIDVEKKENGNVFLKGLFNITNEKEFEKQTKKLNYLVTGEKPKKATAAALTVFLNDWRETKKDMVSALKGIKKQSKKTQRKDKKTLKIRVLHTPNQAARILLLSWLTHDNRIEENLEVMKNVILPFKGIAAGYLFLGIVYKVSSEENFREIIIERTRLGISYENPYKKTAKALGTLFGDEEEVEKLILAWGNLLEKKKGTVELPGSKEGIEETIVDVQKVID